MTSGPVFVDMEQGLGFGVAEDVFGGPGAFGCHRSSLGRSAYIRVWATAPQRTRRHVTLPFSDSRS